YGMHANPPPGRHASGIRGDGLVPAEPGVHAHGMAQSAAELLDEATAAPLAGWDFTWPAERMTTHPPPRGWRRPVPAPRRLSGKIPAELPLEVKGCWEGYQGMGTTDPKDDLHRYLQISRDAVLWKLDGLSEYDARRPLVPTGSNLLGVVKHLAGVELGYFGATFGRPF